MIKNIIKKKLKDNKINVATSYRTIFTGAWIRSVVHTTLDLVSDI